MSRLVVNPGTPHAWQIQLKPGVNLLGRNSGDHRIEDPSVSGSHCEIRVDQGRAMIKDLNSTNGTYVRGARIQEMALEPGQPIRLGAVELLYETESTGTPAATAIAAATAPGPIAAMAGAASPGAGVKLPAMRVNAPAMRVSTPAVVSEAPPPAADIPAPPPMRVAMGPTYCKFHPKSPGRYQCRKCNRCFCELCITARGSQKLCRTCQVELTPLQVHYEAPAEAPGFFASLPGTLIYPFRGMGVLILIFSTLVFTGLDFMAGRFGGLNVLMSIVAIGYLFTFLQAIIHSTAAGDNAMPELPGFDGLFAAFGCFAGTILLSFGPLIGMVAVVLVTPYTVPMSAIIAAVIFGCLYFPMAFLVVAMKDTVVAANPLVVVPSILRVPVEYIVTVIVLLAVFGIQQLGNFVASLAADETYRTHDMSVLIWSIVLRVVWSFASVYLMVVNTRILGMLYLSKKEELGW